MPDIFEGSLSATFAYGMPSDVVLSPDGATLYVATTGGQILVYNVVTRALTATWNVGNTLGGFDVSPDGSFLLIAEREPVSENPATSTSDATTTLTAYRVDTTTGAVISLPLTIPHHQGAGFYDVEILDDGRARLTHEHYSSLVRELEIASGQYSTVAAGFGPDGVLVGSNDHSQTLFSSQRLSPPELAIFGANGAAVARFSGHQTTEPMYQADGILALSLERGLAVQHQYSVSATGDQTYTRLLVFNLALDQWFDLVSLHPDWSDGRISGVVFDRAGTNLYVLDDDTDTIVQLSTTDWTVVRSFAVGVDIGAFAQGHFGNRLLMTPDGRYFTVVTTSGIQLIENDFLSNNFVGDAEVNILAGGAGNDMVSGGGGNDFISGNAGLDTLTGGDGRDTFWDTASGLAGDTISDFSVDDRIIITDATLAHFTYSLSGSTLTYTGGSLTLTGGFSGAFVASAAVGGGVQLSVQALVNDVRNDFNGDGRSDILWRHDAGHLTEWLGQANGGFADNGANAFANIATTWSVTGIGDFNGDGRDDILWRHDAGHLTEWLGQANGGFVDNGANAFASIGTSWSVTGIGDFNGDGRDDVLWRHETGLLTEWLGQANGSFADNGANAFANIAPSWSVVGTGDFNGDGRDDILWRHDSGHLTEWLGQTNGGFSDNGANAFATIGTSWSVAGTGDFNGDGRNDILWRHDAGHLTEWLGQANGGFIDNGANAFASIGTTWSVASIGDFNGDGRDDILWRHDAGHLTEWLGQANGGFVDNGANAFASIGTSWHVQPEPLM